MQTSSIQCEGLSLFYNDTAAFRDVSLTIPERKITAIMGPSGCGKSSVLTALNRIFELIPHSRIEGRILWQGKNLLAPSVNLKDLRRRIGMIFQQPNPFPLSIWKNLELPLREHGETDAKVIRYKIEGGLKDVGLWEEVRDRLHESALKLSGGQQQRLCITRALLLNPEIILFDEPCSALDPISCCKIEELMLGLKGKVTQVIVTHNIAQARRLADHLAFFWRENDTGGHLVEQGSKDQFLNHPQNPLTASYINGYMG